MSLEKAEHCFISPLYSLKKQVRRDFVAMPDPPQYEMTEVVADLVIRHLEDSRDIARAGCACKAFHSAGKNVQSTRYVCRDIDHVNARKNAAETTSEEKNGESDLHNNNSNNLRDAAQTASPEGNIDVDPGGRRRRRRPHHSPLENVTNGEQETAERHEGALEAASGSENACERAPEDYCKPGRASSERVDDIDCRSRSTSSSRDAMIVNEVQGDVSTGKRTGAGSRNHCWNGDCRERCCDAAAVAAQEQSSVSENASCDRAGSKTVSRHRSQRASSAENVGFVNDRGHRRTSSSLESRVVNELHDSFSLTGERTGLNGGGGDQNCKHRAAAGKESLLQHGKACGRHLGKSCGSAATENNLKDTSREATTTENMDGHASCSAENVVNLAQYSLTCEQNGNGDDFHQAQDSLTCEQNGNGDDFLQAQDSLTCEQNGNGDDFHRAQESLTCEQNGNGDDFQRWSDRSRVGHRDQKISNHIVEAGSNCRVGHRDKKISNHIVEAGSNFRVGHRDLKISNHIVEARSSSRVGHRDPKISNHVVEAGSNSRVGHRDQKLSDHIVEAGSNSSVGHRDRKISDLIVEAETNSRVGHRGPKISNHIVEAGSSSRSKNKNVDDMKEEALDGSSTDCNGLGQSIGRKQKQQQQLKKHISFRQALEQDLRSKPCIQQLRIEIEPKLQSKSVPVEEKKLSDFWLSDPLHLMNWVPSLSRTLQHLCIVDYGQQAIPKKSSILKILSQYCKRLKTIDLRNMFIDTKECEQMPELLSFTLRCVKMNGDALDDISDKMESLQTLALLGVFGIQSSCLRLPQLKVLCLGLSTKARTIKLDLQSLSKLQLKMVCPKELCLIAPALKFVAFNLEVRVSSAIKFIGISSLQELLYGASNFPALSMLVKGNWLLNKLFLDIPCMALGEDGKWLGVLKEVMLNIPSFGTLRDKCPNLEILNIGPGVWYSMETNIEEVQKLKRWPPVKTLILHMIPQTLAASVTLLNKLRTEMRETLVNLELNIHTTSPVGSREFLEAIEDDKRGLNFNWKPWTKSLDFSCFTF